MSWENEYKSKLTTAEKAVELIKSGNRVVIGHACAEPSYLVDAMVANAESYHDVEIVHMVAMGKAGYAQPGMESHFRHNALFVGGTTRKAVAEGRGDYASMHQTQILPRSWSMMPRSLNSLRRRSAMWSAPSAQTAHP